MLRGRFGNASVAASTFRGVVAGLVVVALVLLALLLIGRLSGYEVGALFSFMLGPFWENTHLVGLSMPLFFLAYAVAYGLAGTILPLPFLVERFGALRAGVLVAVLFGVLTFPPAVLLPTPWGVPLWILTAASIVFLYLRFDLLTAIQANWVSGVVVAAIPFLLAADRWLQFQGALALLIPTLPMWLSVRHLGSDRVFDYSWDDVPPHVKRIAERERQRVEIETARQIQGSILPDLPAQLNGVSLAHCYLPASEVGGDFYDVIALEDGRLAVAVGDVAGHGVSSGLVMSMVRSALAVQVKFKPEVEDVFETLNHVVHESARRRLLTTLLYAVVDPKAYTVRFASAGHLYPYRMTSGGEVKVLESTAYPLGVRPRLNLETREARLQPGDALFLSTDGLVEARGPDGEELFGFDRLEESLARHSHRQATAILAGVLDDLDRFVGGGDSIDPYSYHRDDDMTVLVLKLPGS